jgi:superfamily II DNA/RNA helicase
VLLQVLVMCPTQELCMQVLRAARDLLPSHRTKVQPLVGE